MARPQSPALARRITGARAALLNWRDEIVLAPRILTLEQVDALGDVVPAEPYQIFSHPELREPAFAFSHGFHSGEGKLYPERCLIQLVRHLKAAAHTHDAETIEGDAARIKELLVPFDYEIEHDAELRPRLADQITLALEYLTELEGRVGTKQPPPLGARPVEAVSTTTPATVREGLRPCQQLAMQSYERARRAEPELAREPLRKTWLWLREEDTDAEYDPPSFETWSRHVRSARRAARGRPKTTPRHGRSYGGSIVDAKQIDDLGRRGPERISSE